MLQAGAYSDDIIRNVRECAGQSNRLDTNKGKPESEQQKIRVITGLDGSDLTRSAGSKPNELAHRSMNTSDLVCPHGSKPNYSNLSANQNLTSAKPRQSDLHGATSA